MDKIKSDVYNILSEQFLISKKEIADNIGPGDLPNWDSIGHLQLILKLEQHFNIQLSVDDVMSINNVKDIIRTVSKCISGEEVDIIADETRPVSASSFSAIRLPKAAFWGNGSIAVLSKANQERIVVITGSSSYTTKIKNKIDEIFNNTKNLSFIQRSSGEPTESKIYQLAEKVNYYLPDLIVAVGGGSTIDITKLSWTLYEHPELKLGNLEKPFSIPSLRAKSSFIAIPTTFGSGSEVSSSAAFSKNESIGKTIIVSHEFIPDKVILDPSLGKNTPLNIIYASAFDALTHAVEGYVSVVRNPLVEPHAISAIKNILIALNKVKVEGLSTEVLELLCYSAYYAGIVQNHCSVGLIHSIAHQLGKFGIAHGVGTGMFLSPIIEYNAQKTDKYKNLVKECGFNSIEDFVELIKSIFRQSNLSPNSKILEDLKNNREAIIEAAMKDITFKTNPVYLEKNDVKIVFNNLIKEFLQ